MKGLLRFLIIVGTLVGIGFAAFQPLKAYWAKKNKPQFNTVEIDKGDIISEVSTTGEVRPVLSVIVGSFVSGPIDELHVDFNDYVKKGDLLAEIDTRIYEAAVARDEATLATARAEKKRVEALLAQSRRDEKRAQALREENVDFISEAEMDQVKYSRMSFEAQLTVAGAAIKQAQANLRNSQANLDYTKIKAPVDGIIILKSIDAGQTLASQFQAPELFTIGVELDKRVHVYALVDENEIGLVKKAQLGDRPVFFTVDGYPGELFEGKIVQIRMSAEETQNVVTYPVIIEAPNPELKLLPSMTVNISFEVDNRKDVLKIPNAALRFFPDAEHVREKDKHLVSATAQVVDDSEDDSAELSAREKVEADQRRRKRHVWTLEGEKLRAIEIHTGISDLRYTEMLDGELEPGQKLVTGLKTD